MPAKARFLRSARIVSSGQRVGLLFDRERFAGQRRLLDPQIALTQEPQVGRHTVAGLQQHDVAWHELRRGDSQLLAATPHRGLGDDHLRQRLDGFLRLCLLDVADDGVEEHDAEDDRRIDPFAEKAVTATEPSRM